MSEIGRVYAPFLLANSAAAEKGDERVDRILGGTGCESLFEDRESIQ